MTYGPVGAGFAAVAAAVGSAWLGASVEPAPEDVSPGVLGFLVTLAIVLACIPLFRSMTGKIRGVQFRDAENQDPAGPDAVPSPDPLPTATRVPEDPPPGPPATAHPEPPARP